MAPFNPWSRLFGQPPKEQVPPQPSWISAPGPVSATMTVVISGAPPHLRRPKPLPGETPAQMVIRNHAHEWRNFLERMQQKLGVPKDERERLEREGPRNVRDQRLIDEIERFMTRRLPVHGRTLEDLAHLRHDLETPFQVMLPSFRLVQVLWPRETHPEPDSDQEVEKIAASLDVTVIPLPTGSPRALDLFGLLPTVEGDFVWIVPGCTRASLHAPLSLVRIKRGFDVQPRCALYTDSAGSYILRTSALRQVAPASAGAASDINRLLAAAGFLPIVDNAPAAVLFELEPEYGGPAL